jgi:hypothetical protein
VSRSGDIEEPEVPVNISRTAFVLVVAIAASTMPGCAKKGDAAPQAPVTHTIAPAAAQPAANGTDAMTGTVEVEENRSENEGGVLTDSQAAKNPESATHKTPATRKGPRASSKKP